MPLARRMNSADESGSSCTRRAFFRQFATEISGLWSAAAEGAGTAEATVPPTFPWAPRPAFTRPPGALPEAEFLAACSRCGDCVRACEPLALRKAGPEMGRLYETSIIVPSENPCTLCEGLPCVAACGTGALKR